jgi:hypothetical protein
MPDEPPSPAGRTAPEPAPRAGESRWWPAAALLLFMALNIGLRIWLPNEGAVRTPWLLPAIEAVLLAVLVASHPGNLATYSRLFHRIAISLVCLLVVAALWSTGLLVYDLIKGLGVTDDPGQLLAAGGLVWLGNSSAPSSHRRAGGPCSSTTSTSASRTRRLSARRT